MEPLTCLIRNFNRRPPFSCSQNQRGGEYFHTSKNLNVNKAQGEVHYDKSLQLHEISVRLFPPFCFMNVVKDAITLVRPSRTWWRRRLALSEHVPLFHSGLSFSLISPRLISIIHHRCFKMINPFYQFRVGRINVHCLISQLAQWKCRRWKNLHYKCGRVTQADQCFWRGGGGGWGRIERRCLRLTNSLC